MNNLKKMKGEGEVIFLVFIALFGALFFPIAIVHGIGVWLGAW